jgi:hypothetical protein
MTGAVAVTGVATACQAVDLIIDQGEGTLTSPLDGSGDDVAHYYRLAEIVHGRRLVRNPDTGPDTPAGQRYVYAGDPVPVDPAGVLAAPRDPKLADYPPGSPARLACAAFNRTYAQMLKTLQAAVQGSPGELTPAVTLMFSLRQQAAGMLSGSATGGTPAGPSFEWQGE